MKFDDVFSETFFLPDAPLNRIFPQPLSDNDHLILLKLHDQVVERIRLMLNESLQSDGAELLMPSQKKHIISLLKLQNEIIELTGVGILPGQN